MTNTFKTSARTMLVALLAAIAAIVVVAPAFASAAMFAYVNQAGDVASVNAATAEAALASAPNIDEHSGVLLLDSTEDEALVGDDVTVK